MRSIPTLLLGVLLMSTLLSAAPATRPAEATGAAAFWTSDEPLIAHARDLVTTGRFADAEKLLAADSSDSATDALDIIARIRNEYGLDDAALLKQIRPLIADISADDLKRWRDAGQVQFRTIDGELRYFRRSLSNLRLFNSEFQKRAPAAAEEKEWKLVDHLAAIVREAESTGKAEVTPVQHRVTYKVTIPANSPALKTGSIVRAWLPFPQTYRQQQNVELVSASPAKPRISPDGTGHRSAYFETTIADLTKLTTFEITFDYTSFAYYPILDPAKAQPLPSDFDAAYLAERLPHIQFSPKLREQVKQIVGDETNSLLRAKKIYLWIDANVPWHAEDEYCIIPSISEKALAIHRGDCGVQGLLFITMCRAAGVPARWQSGWETKPINWNMHDWAEFYIEPWGWLPADASYGLQKSDDPKVREFYFGHQDAYRLIVNRDYGQPLSPLKTSQRSEPLDFQRGEIEVDGKNLYFDKWDYEISFQRTPGP